MGAKQREAAPGTFPIAGVGRDIRFNKRQCSAGELGAGRSGVQYSLQTDY